MLNLRRRGARLLATISLLLTTAPACKDLQAERVAYMQMQPAGDGLLVVGHIPDALTGEQRLGRIALLDTKGIIQHTLDERTVFAVEGITPEVVWITRKTITGDLSANATDTLAPMPGIGEALAGHPVLSTSYNALGMHGDKLVLEGADSRRYTIDAAGSIETLAEGATIEAPPPTTGGLRDQVGLRLEPLPKGADERNARIHAALDNPTAFTDSTTLLGADSTDLLVQSTVFAEGTASSQISRVSATGDILWSATLAKLAAPLTIQDAETKLVALTPLGDTAWLLIRASTMSRHQQQDYYEVEHRLVRLDVGTGAAAESHTVRARP